MAEEQQVEKAQPIEKTKEATYSIHQFLQIANVLKHDQLYYEKHYGGEEPKTIADWKALTKLTF